VVVNRLRVALFDLAHEIEHEARRVAPYLKASADRLDESLDDLDEAFTERAADDPWPAQAEKVRNVLVMLVADVRDAQNTYASAAIRANDLIAHLMGKGA
jgi:hypothetical protein